MAGKRARALYIVSEANILKIKFNIELIIPGHNKKFK